MRWYSRNHEHHCFTVWKHKSRIIKTIHLQLNKTLIHSFLWIILHLLLLHNFKNIWSAVFTSSFFVWDNFAQNLHIFSSSIATSLNRYQCLSQHLLFFNANCLFAFIEERRERLFYVSSFEVDKYTLHFHFQESFHTGQGLYYLFSCLFVYYITL